MTNHTACRQDLPTGIRLTKGVVLHQLDGTARLIDAEWGRFFALDEIGAVMLSKALAAGPAAAASEVASEFGAALDEVAADLAGLLAGLQRQGLVIPHRPRRRDELAPWWIWLLLAAAFVSLRCLGMSRTLRLWRTWSRPTRGSPAVDAGVVHAIDVAVRAAAASHVLNTQCKERALVAWHLLKRENLPAEIVIGIDLYPFAAHAWVESGGMTLTDSAEQCGAFIPVVRYT